MKDKMIQRITRLPKGLRYFEGGFTLIEVIIAIAILTILATIITLNIITFLESGSIGAGRGERSTIQTAVDAMMADAQATQLDSLVVGWQGQSGTVTKDGFDANEYLRRFPTKGTYSVATDGTVSCTDYPGVTDVTKINTA